MARGGDRAKGFLVFFWFCFVFHLDDWFIWTCQQLRGRSQKNRKIQRKAGQADRKECKERWRRVRVQFWESLGILFGQPPLLPGKTNQTPVIIIDFKAALLNSQLVLISYLTDFPKFPFDIIFIMNRSVNNTVLSFISRKPPNFLFWMIYFTILNSCNHFSHIWYVPLV